MSDSEKTREELVDELSALRAQVAKFQGMEGEKATAEEKGRQSDEQVRELAAHLHQVLWAVDATGAKIRYFSPAYEEIWGRTCQTLFDDPRSFVDAIHADDRERVVRALALRHETGRYEEKYRILRPDGSMRWIWDRGYPVQAEQDAIQGFVGIAEDITEQKALQDDQARLAAIVDYSDHSIVSKTVDGIVTSWNHGAERLYGYSAKEMIGQSISTLFAPDHYPEYVEIMKTVKKGLPIPSYDTARRRKDGTEVNISVSISPIQNREGEIVEVSAISQDITERKSAEEQMRLLLESTGEGIYGVDMQGRCTFINQAAAAMLGYVPAEVIGQEMHALIHHHRLDGSLYPVEQCPMYRAMKNQSGVRLYDEVLWRKDGTSFAAEFSSFPVMKRENILGAVVTFQDITQTKQLEAQFRQAQKMEAVGTLAGGVAHDFNNLLTIISGYSELMLLNMPPADPKREALKAIHDAGERAASLTRQLLAFSRKTVMEPKVLDLNNVVKETESMLRRLIGEDILLSFLPDPGIHRIKVDPGLLGQVLMNLAVNSRDAMPQGGKLSIETCNSELDQAYCQDHAGAKPGKFVQLSITDTGCGMTPEIKARVFEPFFTTKALGQGTGLGLAVVYGIIKQSDGYIEVNSEPGVGTCFKIYFQSVDQAADARPADPFASIVRHGTETVLVVEDEDGVRGIALLALQMHGYTVLTARDGKDALRVIGKHGGNIDMLVTDVVMPGMSGRELAEKLGPKFPHMKTLFLSGYTDDAVIRNGLIQEQIAFLQKPFSPLALARKVRAVLDESK
jgi:PAS domain S-box-containing protein